MGYWNWITEDHEHEEGESREKCANCAVDRLVEELTEFELFCIIWFRTNINQFAFDAHLIGEFIKELGLKDTTKALFMKAVGMIYQNDSKISQEKLKIAMRKKRNV